MLYSSTHIVSCSQLKKFLGQVYNYGCVNALKGYYATEVKSLIKMGGERNNWLSSLSIGTNLRLSDLVEARRNLSKYLAHSFELRKAIYVNMGKEICTRVFVSIVF